MNFDRMFDDAKVKLNLHPDKEVRSVWLVSDFLTAAQNSGFIESFRVVRDENTIRFQVHGVDSEFRRNNWSLTANTKAARDSRREGVIQARDKQHFPADYYFHVQRDRCYWPGRIHLATTRAFSSLTQKVQGWNHSLYITNVDSVPELETFFADAALFVTAASEKIREKSQAVRAARAEWDATHPVSETPTNG